MRRASVGGMSRPKVIAVAVFIFAASYLIFQVMQDEKEIALDSETPNNFNEGDAPDVIQPLPGADISLQPNSENEGLLTFETIDRGHYSSLVERGEYVIKTQKDFENFWENKIYGTSDSKPPLPAVDFTKETVIAIGAGIEPSTGYSVEVRRIANMRDRIDVSVEEIFPGEGCLVGAALTQPYHIIKFARQDDKKISFIKESKTTEC